MHIQCADNWRVSYVQEVVHVFEWIDVDVNNHLCDLRERREQIHYTVRILDLAFGNHFPLMNARMISESSIGTCLQCYLFKGQHVYRPVSEVIFLLFNKQPNKVVENLFKWNVRYFPI